MLLRSKRKLPEFDTDEDGGQNRGRRRLKLESSSKSFPNTYKSSVLKLLKNKDQSNRLTCDLRMALFIAAAQDPNRSSYLVPFPHCFINTESEQRDYDQVAKLIAKAKIPGFLNIEDSTELPDLTWELLDWVLNHNTNVVIEPWVKDIPGKLEELKIMTGLENLPVPDNSNVFMFKITYPQPKPEFTEAKKKFGSKFAFHGSSAKNFHSILHRGLMCSFNVRSGFGHGTYMSPDIYTSSCYSLANQGRGWIYGFLGNTFKCIAIVEFAMSPDTKDFHKFGGVTPPNPTGVYVCDNDDHMQISHLILYRQ